MAENMIDIICGDSLEVLKKYPDNHFHSVVTDPPYGLSFMGKKWDHSVPSIELWKEVFRVLRPGGHMLVACGTRTQHRMAVNIEDAGFEIRDVITWHYGSGFPKSMDISKAIDKYKGESPKIIGKRTDGRYAYGFSKNVKRAMGNEVYNHTQGFAGEMGLITEPTTEEAKQWEGWGTALKPATEFWTLCRKPISEKTIIGNVFTHGTGAININACRIALNGEAPPTGSAKRIYAQNEYSAGEAKYGDNTTTPLSGRFPANVIFDPYTASLLDMQAPKAGAAAPVKTGYNGESKGIYGDYASKGDNGQTFYDDTGGASRFFYCAKASRQERNRGLSETQNQPIATNTGNNHNVAPLGRETEHSNYHPTVKPVKLMQYLVTLITPPHCGIVLDPFNGSGSTGIACKTLGFSYVGIEKEAEYCAISRARIAAWDGPMSRTQLPDQLQIDF